MDNATPYITIVLLIIDRVGHSTLLSHTERAVWDLLVVSSVSVPGPPTHLAHSDLELFLCLTMAAYWIFGQESLIVAYAWCSRSLVDRSSD